MWESEYERSDDEIAASDAPAFEVVLERGRHGYLLAELLARGGGTLAVLEFPGGESEPADWVTRELDTTGLSEAIREANCGTA